MKVLVCGGRSYSDWQTVYDALDALPVTMVVQGGAGGADALAKDWANSRLRPVMTYHAEWEKHGKAAGPIRNQEMLDDAKPDMVLAFAGGRGTADMIRRAEKAGVTVKRVGS